MNWTCHFILGQSFRQRHWNGTFELSWWLNFNEVNGGSQYNENDLLPRIGARLFAEQVEFSKITPYTLARPQTLQREDFGINWHLNGNEKGEFDSI